MLPKTGLTKAERTRKVLRATIFLLDCCEGGLVLIFSQTEMSVDVCDSEIEKTKEVSSLMSRGVRTALPTSYSS